MPSAGWKAGDPQGQLSSWVAGQQQTRIYLRVNKWGFLLVRAQDGSEGVAPADGRIAGKSRKLLRPKPISKTVSHWLDPTIVLGPTVCLLGSS